MSLPNNNEQSTAAAGGPHNIIDMTDKIWKALRLVPEFDGNPHILTRFLDICDQLILSYMNPQPGNELNNSALLNGILNKITGRAAATLASNGIPRNWEGIRNALINSFSDHRDESALYTDLSMLSQGSDTPHVFYERVQNLLCTIMTYVELHESLPSTIEAKRELYKKLALQTYIRGLHEPLGSRIRCMRPETLEKALEFAQDELNVLYLKQKHTVQPFTAKRQGNFNPFKFSPINTSQMTIPNQQNSLPIYQIRPNTNYVPNNPSQAVNQIYNACPPTFGPPQSSPYFRPPGPGFSRTQQMMRALPRSNMTTGFRIPQRTPQPSFPKPMSGISHPNARILPPTPQHPQQQINMNEIHYPELYYDEYLPDYLYDYYTTSDPSENENLTQDQPETEQQNFSQDPIIDPPE